MAEDSGASGYRRALALMTSSSLLVPLVGLATAPILAQALGVDGRGEAAAALAPNALVVSIATLGLPEALTYHLARRPHSTRPGIAWSTGVSVLVGALCLVATVLFAPLLAAGDPELAQLIVLGTALAVPMLIVNLLRGAAAGRQMWGNVAAERVVNSLLRLAALATLAVAGQLSVLNAVLVMSIAPVVAGFVYWRLALRPPMPDEPPEKIRLATALLGFGSRIWLGSVASMVLGRLGQLLMTPLSDVRQLGLFVVAVTISDVPFIVATALRDALFGVESKGSETGRLATTSRLATVVGLLGSLVLGGTLPFWIGPLFGAGFEQAMVPTWLLLAATVVNIPGLIIGGGLGAWDRPGLRSWSMAIALGGNLIGFVLLVPPLGATGAGIAGIIGGLAATAFAVIAIARLSGTPARAFLIPSRGDVTLMRAEIGRLLARFRRRGPG